LAPQPAGHADILQPVRWAKAYDQAGEGSAAIGPTAVVDLMQGGSNTADTVDQRLSSWARFALDSALLRVVTGEPATSGL